MKKLRAGVFTLLLVLSITAFGSAQTLIPPQVKYEMEILELRSTEERALVLEAFEFQSSIDAAEFAFEFLAGQDLSGILGGLPFRLTAQVYKERSGSLAVPAVIVSLGRTASLRVVEETLRPELSASGTHFRTSGVEIQVTPLMVDSIAGEISSAFVIQTGSGENEIRTTAILQNGESLPLAILRFTQDSTDNSEERLFAVFVRAEIIEEPPETAGFAIGGLGGLEGLLWPEEIVFDRENYFWIALPITPINLPEGGFQVGQRVYVRGDLQHASYSPATVAGGIALLPEGLDLEVQIIWYEGQAYAAVGLADTLEIAPGIVLTGGFIPAVIGLADYQQEKPLYWFGGSLTGRPFNFRFQVLSGLKDDAPTVQSEVDYAVKDNFSVFIKLSMNQDRGNRISAGVRLTF